MANWQQDKSHSAGENENKEYHVRGCSVPGAGGLHLFLIKQIGRAVYCTLDIDFLAYVWTSFFLYDSC